MVKKKTTIRSKKTTQKAQASTELGLLARALRGGGSAIGSGLGSLFGPAGIATGASLGNSLGASISRWLGAGDYTLRSNSLVTRAAKGVPMMHFGGETTVIRHREYIGDVTTGGINTFNANAFPINPGVATIFPWLSSIAQQYQEYTFKGLVFHYISTSGDSVGSTTTSLPTVMMATQYKANANTFTDKLALLNASFSNDAKASEDFCHPVECDPRENPFKIQYVRGAAPPTGDDLMMYDLGKFTIATAGSQAANVVVGELWVTYEVELRKPIASAISNEYIESAFLSRSGAANGAFFGTAFLATNSFFDNIGLTCPTSNSLQFPTGITGTFVISLYYPGATVVTAALDTTVVNATRLNKWGATGAQGAAVSPQTAAATVAMAYTLVIDITDNTKPALITFIAGTVTFGSGSTVNICVTPTAISS